MKKGVTAFATACLLSFAVGSQPRAQGLPLSRAGSWGYWLANIDPAAVAASGFDMVVIDYSADGSAARAFSRQQVERMQRKPDGSRRLLIAYLSIGEAESYRYYWQPGWRSRPPAWLEKENPRWPGDYKVRYWERGWQRIIYGSPGAYLDHIIAAGFDGVMLDVVDAYDYFAAQNPASASEMVDFVEAISRYAKAERPGFLILPQNGEGLLEYPGYLAAVDGVVKEALFYGVKREGSRNPPDEVAYSTSLLERARSAGKPVFTVDYVSRQSQVADVYRRSRSDGFVPYAARRDLGSLTVNRGWDPPG